MKLAYLIYRFLASTTILILAIILIFALLPYRDLLAASHLNIANLQLVNVIELPEWRSQNAMPKIKGTIKGTKVQKLAQRNRLYQALVHLKTATQARSNVIKARANRLSGQIAILLLDWNYAQLAFANVNRLAPNTFLRPWEKIFLLPLSNSVQSASPAVLDTKDLLETADISFRYQQFAVASKYYELTALNEYYQKTHRIDYQSAITESTSYVLYQYLLASALSSNENVNQLISVMKQRESKFEVVQIPTLTTPVVIEGWKFIWLFNGSPVDTNGEVGYLWSPQFATVLVNVHDDGDYVVIPSLMPVGTDLIESRLFVDGSLLQQFESHMSETSALHSISVPIQLAKGFHTITIQILSDTATNEPKTGAIESLLIRYSS